MKKLLWILLLCVSVNAQSLKEFKITKVGIVKRIAWIETRDGKFKWAIWDYRKNIGYHSDGVSIGKMGVQPIAYQDVIRFYPHLKRDNPDSVLFYNDKFNHNVAVHYLYILRNIYGMKTDKDLLIAYNAGLSHVWHYRKSGVKCIKYLIGEGYSKEVLK